MERHWLVRPQTVRLLRRVLYTVLALSVGAELLIAEHALFAIGGSFAFNAWFGFAACIVLILAAKGLGISIKRADTYYDAPGPTTHDDDR